MAFFRVLWALSREVCVSRAFFLSVILCDSAAVYGRFFKPHLQSERLLNIPKGLAHSDLEEDAVELGILGVKIGAGARSDVSLQHPQESVSSRDSIETSSSPDNESFESSMKSVNPSRRQRTSYGGTSGAHFRKKC